jgi:NADP-dependent 3-hydroxy acid dehydrogenase YdfG
MQDQVILIVGGSGGIGSASAELLARTGASIVLAARDTEKAEATAAIINGSGGNAYVIAVDVTDLASVTHMVSTVHTQFGRIDVLINAFGLGSIKPLLDIQPKDAKQVIDVNVYGTFLVTQTVMRVMETAKQGTVIMFPGILGKAVMKNSALYSASKYAITGFTKALIEENRRNRIKFTLFYLGGVDTAFWESPQIDMKVQKDKMLTPQEVAKAVYYAVTQPMGSVLSEIVLQPESHVMI